MKVYRRQRGAGKTRACILRAKAIGYRAVIVVPNYAQIDNISCLCREMELGSPPKMITVADLRKGALRGTRPEPILIIDDLDTMMDTLFGFKVDLVTMTE